jgi:carbon monoxide dehydrogenase subunit G
VIVEGGVTVKAPMATVWDFVYDPAKLASLIPGCQGVEMIDETTYSMKLRVRVGIFHVDFGGIAKVQEMTPPGYARIVTEGKDKLTGTMISLKTIVDLKPVETNQNETQLSYTNDVAVIGKLAVLGDAVMRAKAKQMKEEFETKLKSQFEPK